MALQSFKNPKQGKKHGGMAPSISGYNYYAAYSSPFVHSVFDEFQMAHGSCVLDPWNGSGTTTRVAKSRKVNGIGFDLNPATLVIAKAGLTDWNTIASSVQPLSQHLLEQTQRTVLRKHLTTQKNKDPFRQWFTSETSDNLRYLELTVRATLVGLSPPQTTQFSPLAAFFYLALFKTARNLSKPFCGSNPTWIKTAKDSASELRISRETIHLTFSEAVKELSDAFENWEKQQAISNARNSEQNFLSDVRLDIADSRCLPMADKSVDAVVTSPPYCTRIDYVVAMLPELAVIGFPLSDADDLRRRLLGTTKVPESIPNLQPGWGKSCNQLLNAMEVHPSHASQTYYLKWAAQYFDSLYKSILEINRVLKPGCPCAIVVQDSHYKEIKIDLPLIVREMSESINWAYQGKTSHIEKQTMAAVNPNSKVYRENNDAEECVLVFKTSKNA